ncbi:MAG TPA: hypothetical protein VFD05_02760 [Bacilli bacterium]|nr:hypothetical protein [Bacilli bacterium]
MKIDLKIIETKEFVAEQEAAFQKFKSDALFMTHLKSLNLTPELIQKNKAPLIAYYDSFLSVKACEKAGECVNEHSYHHMSLTLHNEFINLKYELCPIYAISELRHSRFVYSDFPDNYCVPKRVTRREAQRAYLVALREFNEDKINTLYVHGPFGVGKFTLAMTAINRFLKRDKNATVGVLDFRNFTSEYSTDYFENKIMAQNALLKAIAVDFLIVREFGNEESNKLIRDAFSFPLVTERIKAGKKTIFLSELSLNDLHSLYDVSRRDVRVKQIINMIEANAAEVHVTGVKI